MMKEEFCLKYGCNDDVLSLEDYEAIETLYYNDHFDVDCTGFCERFKKVPLKNLVELAHIVLTLAHNNNELAKSVCDKETEIDRLEVKLHGLREIVARHRNEITQKEIEARIACAEQGVKNDIALLMED